MLIHFYNYYYSQMVWTMEKYFNQERWIFGSYFRYHNNFIRSHLIWCFLFVYSSCNFCNLMNLMNAIYYQYYFNIPNKHIGVHISCQYYDINSIFSNNDFYGICSQRQGFFSWQQLSERPNYWNSRDKHIALHMAVQLWNIHSSFSDILSLSIYIWCF